jgi:protein-S-isoprenylcysteine O-methyltransferase Ste14
LMVVPTVLWLGNIVMYVSLLSVYALILAAAAAEEASKKEEDK